MAWPWAEASRACNEIARGSTHYHSAVADPIVLAVLFFGGALLYASVGHAGASAYLAAMGLLGLSPDVARPTALALNIIVASFVTFRFWRGGYLSGRVLAPFLLGSIPLAYLGGTHVAMHAGQIILLAKMLASCFARQ